MTSIVLEGPIADIREREVQLLFDLAEEIARQGDEAKEDRDRLKQNAADLRDMFFLVVIVGEFNAGKSTFVNALLGDQLLPTGITPTTEYIELIRHGDKNTPPEIKEHDAVREWQHPNTGTPGVVIVDTPGTGSVFAKHERIAKRFLSRSDLVLFLFSAKKAFAQTEKLYLELARNYGKKIILVLNQMDLLDKDERSEVVTFVKQQMAEMVDIEPPIFPISAKKATQAKRPGGLFSRASEDESGMSDVKAYLQQIFERVPPAKQKLISQLDFADSVITKYRSSADDYIQVTGADKAYATQLREELESQAKGLSGRLDTTMTELNRVFDQLRERGKTFIADNLTLGKGFRAPDRDDIRRKFEEEVIGNAISKISDISEDYVNAVVDSSRRYWRNIIERLNKIQALMEQEIGAPDARSYAAQRDALQDAIAIADAQLKTYHENNLAESLRDTFANNLSRFTTSIVGVIAGIVAVAVGVAAAGPVTATAIGVIGALVAGPVLVGGGAVGALLYSRKMRQDAYHQLDERLDTLSKSYRQALEDMTERERTRLLQYGEEILSPVFSRLDVLANSYQEQRASLIKLADTAQQLRAELDRIQVRVESPQA
jgi:small GTP-binding protein